MYYNGRQFSSFRGLNLLAANGALRFEDVDVAPTTTSGEYLMYVDGGVLYFDNGSGTVALGAAGAAGSVSWEQMYATDNTINVAGGDGLSISGAMSNSNDVLTLNNAAGSSGDVLQIANLGTGKDIDGTSSTWSFTKAGVLDLEAITIDTSGTTDIIAVTANSILAHNALILAGSGTFTGTGANSFANVTASGLTTGTAFTVIANTATTSVGVADISTTGLTSGSSLRVTSGGANMTTGAKSIEVAMGAATAGSGLSVVTSGTHIGTTTDSLINVTSAGTSGTMLYLVGNSMTTGVAQLITSSGTLTTTGSLLTLTGNSATTAAGLFRINANGLTSGIGAVIASSATAMTGAGRLLRVDHTGATGSTAILSEFASAANDETVIVKITASDALAAGTMLQLSGASVTTGNGITIANLNALTDGYGFHLASSNTTISSTGRLMYVNHTGNAGVSAILSEFASAAADETVIVKITASAANALGSGLLISTATTTGTGEKITANSLTTGQGLLIQSSVATTVLTTTGRLLKVDHTGNATGTGTIAEIASAAADETVIALVTASAALTGSALKVDVSAMVSGDGILIAATEATLTTGKYIRCYDGAADDFSVAKYGATVIAGNAAGTAALTLTAGKLVVTDCDASTFTSADGTASVLVVTNTAGLIAQDAGALEVVANGAGSNADSAVVRITQDNTAGVSFCLNLKQDDLDVGFINFEGTASADANSPISTHGTPGATTDFVRCAINGTKAWIAVSTNDPTA